MLMHLLNITLVGGGWTDGSLRTLANRDAGAAAAISFWQRVRLQLRCVSCCTTDSGDIFRN